MCRKLWFQSQLYEKQVVSDNQQVPFSAVILRQLALTFTDGPSTIVLGESFGAPLAALAASVPHRSRLVLIAPVIATQSEIVRAGLAG